MGLVLGELGGSRMSLSAGGGQWALGEAVTAPAPLPALLTVPGRERGGIESCCG